MGRFIPDRTTCKSCIFYKKTHYGNCKKVFKDNYDDITPCILYKEKQASYVYEKNTENNNGYKDFIPIETWRTLYNE